MTKTTLIVTGMKCGKCEAHMNQAVKEAFSVKSVTSSHENNETIIISREPLDEQKLRETVAETGYTLEKITSEPYKKKGLFGF